jgi:hypothetical protein
MLAESRLYAFCHFPANPFSHTTLYFISQWDRGNNAPAGQELPRIPTPVPLNGRSSVAEFLPPPRPVTRPQAANARLSPGDGIPEETRSTKRDPVYIRRGRTDRLAVVSPIFTMRMGAYYDIESVKLGWRSAKHTGRSLSAARTASAVARSPMESAPFVLNPHFVPCSVIITRPVLLPGGRFRFHDVSLASEVRNALHIRIERH